MVEGWQGDDYFILFAEDEVSRTSKRYGIETALPGFQVVGLRGWDEFVVRDQSGRVFTVPTVPCDMEHLEPFQAPSVGSLAEDARRVGKIKWYVTPIVFGGDPAIGPNLTWIDHDQHGRLVRWWNDQYRALTAKRMGR